MFIEPQNLIEWLEYLEKISPQSGIHLGLDAIKSTGSAIGALNTNAFVYTVAGTNGKGSTIAILESILLKAGYNVGSYTSPHIESFNERIKINGINITDDLICESFSYVAKSHDADKLSYFEFITVAAFHCFSQHDLDVIILEVGMGGRLDAVNVIDPDVSIITSIGLDHQKFLGDTEEKIAYEKSGIMRHNVPLVYGAETMYATILDQSSLNKTPVYSKGNSFYFTNDHDNNVWHWSGISSRGKELKITSIPLPYNLVLDNAATAIQALQFFKNEIPIESIKQGLNQIKISGRCHNLLIEYKNKTVDVILDVAHNPQAIEYFINQLNLNKKTYAKANVVFAVFADKNYKKMLNSLKKITAQFFVTSIGHERSLSTDKLSDYLSALPVNNSKHSSVADALISALNSTNNTQPLIIVGSFHLIEEAIKFFKVKCNSASSSFNSKYEFACEGI